MSSANKLVLFIFSMKIQRYIYINMFKKVYKCCFRKMLKLKIIMSFNNSPMEIISPIVYPFNMHFLMSILGTHTLNMNSHFSSSISFRFNCFIQTSHFTYTIFPCPNKSQLYGFCIRSMHNLIKYTLIWTIGESTVMSHYVFAPFYYCRRWWHSVF